MAYDQMCPRYEHAFELLGKKWTGLILRILMGGPKRFSAFRAQVPELSDRLLSERLKELEDEGVVRRLVHSTKPVVVEYELTTKGQALEQVVHAVQAWSEAWIQLPVGH